VVPLVIHDPLSLTSNGKLAGHRVMTIFE